MGCVIHSFNKHSQSHGGAPDLGLTLGTKMNQAWSHPQKTYIPPPPHQVALENMFQQSALGCAQDRLTAVGRD